MEHCWRDPLQTTPKRSSLSSRRASHCLRDPLTQQVAMLLGPSASKPLVGCSCP